MGLFERFSHILFPLRESERRVREATEDDVLRLIAPSKITHETEDVVALLPYKDPLVSALVLEAKYHGNQEACTLLGRVLAEYLGAFVAEEDAYQERDFSLVPIPLSKRRLRERGHNQAERIAACALTHLGIEGAPSAGVLERVRDTPSQTHLPRAARMENVKGAFVAHGVNPLFNYILVDDVVTTGATLSCAAEALREAGASRVICVALAH